LAGREQNRQDKTRICPFCRMEISVFATKCFHCGERVDPPRTDQRHFSMEDLGGRRTTKYAPSESVMAALETFRAELIGDIQSDKEGAAGGQAGHSGERNNAPAPPESGLPSLDEHSRALASLHEESRPTGAFAQPYAQPGSSLSKRLGTVLAILIVLAVLAVGGFGLYRMQAGEEQEPAVVTMQVSPPNRAPQLLEEGKLLEALSAAREAIGLDASEKNKAIQKEVCDAIAAKAEEHLNAEPWHPEDLVRARELTSQAAIIDPDQSLLELEEKVKQEEYAYGMMLVRPEPERGGGTAKFRLNALSEAAQEAGDKFVTVETGEKFAGRFRLIQVGRSEAVVEDLLRNRRIAYYVSGNYAPAE